jgi:hypothetical protein
MAKGSRVEQPTKAILGEAGPEMVLPTKYTRLFDAMADQYAASPEDEFADLFGKESPVSESNLIYQSQKTKLEDEFADLFKESAYDVAKPNIDRSIKFSAPDMVLPARAGSAGGLASGASGSNASTENLLEKILEAVQNMGVEVLIDSEKVGAKIMKKIQRKQGASW